MDSYPLILGALVWTWVLFVFLSSKLRGWEKLCIVDKPPKEKTMCTRIFFQDYGRSGAQTISHFVEQVNWTSLSPKHRRD